MAGVGFTTCPHCGNEIINNVYKRHVLACGKFPEEAVLKQWYKNETAVSIARRIGVDEEFVRRRYQLLGINKFPCQGKKISESPALAGPEFAPRRGIKIGCTDCKEYEDCKQRLEKDLWPLCCLPTRMEVFLAYREGKIGFDDNMPKWLPELMKEIQIR